MSNTNINTLKQNIQNSSIFLISFLLLILGLFATLTSTSSKAQSNTSTSSTISASSQSATASSPLAISGTGTAGNTISVKFPDGTTASTTIKSDGSYVIIPLKVQDAGNVIVTEYSPLGAVVASPKTVPYAGGATTPTATAIAPKLSIKDPYLCPGKIAGSVDNAKATVTIEISKSGVVVLTLPAIVNSDGTWAIDIANKLPDGAYTNKFTATYNSMIATGTYDFMHKNACPTAATTSASTIRTGGANLMVSIASLSAIVIGLYVVMIKKFNK